MPLSDRYGVLKGRPVGRRPATGQNTHYHIHLVSPEDDWRIAVNCKSNLAPSEVEYVCVENFSHVVLQGLPGLEQGFTELKSQPGGIALDFVRMRLFDREALRPLPYAKPGADNDLNEKIDREIARAMSDEEGMIYAFGGRWGPEPRTPDKIFGFRPGNGIHEIHMNQGNAPQYVPQDGVYQDGALLIHVPGEQRWVGIFTKFQSQTWETDDQTGHAVSGPVVTPTPTPALALRIVAALVNPHGGGASEAETVTLLNASADAIDLGGWSLADRQRNRFALSGRIAAGEAKAIRVAAPVQLSNSGDVISLLDPKGVQAHSVSYTKEQARREGWTVVF